MEGEIIWQPATPDNLPDEGAWVAVANQKGPNDNPAPFPAMLVKAPHGNLWRVLTAKEEEVQYAPIHRNSMWAYVGPP